MNNAASKPSPDITSSERRSFLSPPPPPPPPFPISPWEAPSSSSLHLNPNAFFERGEEGVGGEREKKRDDEDCVGQVSI